MQAKLNIARRYFVINIDSVVRTAAIMSFWAGLILVILKIEYRKLVLGDIYSLANYKAIYKGTNKTSAG